MSSPTLSKKWYTRANAPFPDTSTATAIINSYLFMFKEMLKGTTVSGTEGPDSRPSNTCWTVVGSSDGVTAALDGVDRLTGSVANSYDSTKWVHNASGSAHSWIVLKSPDAFGPVWMCVDCNSATSNQGCIFYSRQAMTSGTTIGRPDANLAWMIGATTNPVQTTNIALHTDSNPGSSYRAHISVCESGSFNFMTSRDGNNIFHHFHAVFNTVNRKPNDNVYTTFVMFNTATTGRGTPVWSTVGAQTAGCVGRSINGQTIPTTGGTTSLTWGGTSVPGTLANDYSSNVPQVFPINVITLTANENSWRGRIPDIWVIGNQPVGGSYPNGSNPTQCVVGDILIPFSVVPII